VAASILVGTTAELREKYAAYDLERRTLGIAASRPKGALAPAKQPVGAQISPVFQGTPDQVVEAVFDDLGLAAADEIVLFLPPAFDLSENVRLLTDLSETVAPGFGWSRTW
jgi:alkanesulfonate monooxygenase SsuD/methylene tetrahydromethanopterin reductase-like flavin-dependent oxidoreductase (luciferase family)